MTDFATEIDPELGDVITALAQAAADQRFGPILAEVISYDSAKQTCDAQPIIAVVIDGEVTTLPPIHACPVQWPGGGQAAFTAPLVSGDIVQLIPQMGDISRWQIQGTINQTPDDPRRAALTDMVALPRFRSAANPLPTAAVAEDGPVVYGPVFVYLGGSDAVDFVALASKVNGDLAFIHAYLTTIAPLIPATPPAPLPSGGNVGSLRVKTK